MRAAELRPRCLAVLITEVMGICASEPEITYIPPDSPGATPQSPLGPGWRRGSFLFSKYSFKTADQDLKHKEDEQHGVYLSLLRRRMEEEEERKKSPLENSLSAGQSHVLDFFKEQRGVAPSTAATDKVTTPAMPCRPMRYSPQRRSWT